MKKFIVLIIMAFALCSCATYATYGDIALLNNNGETIQRWDNAIIDKDSPTEITRGIKAGGALNFQDEDGVYHYINGGIIIVDNLTQKAITYAERQEYNSRDLKTIIEEYNAIKLQVTQKESELKTLPKNSEEYRERKAEITRLKRQMDELAKKGYTMGGNPSNFGRSNWY